MWRIYVAFNLALFDVDFKVLPGFSVNYEQHSKQYDVRMAFTNEWKYL